TLVQQGLLTQVELTDRQVRRLVRRVEPAGSDLQALVYQRRQPAPNRLPGHVHAAVGARAAARRPPIRTLLPRSVGPARARGGSRACALVCSFSDGQPGEAVLLILRPEDTRGLIRMAEAVEATEIAFRDWGHNHGLNAPRRRIHVPSGVRVSVHQGGTPTLG